MHFSLRILQMLVWLKWRGRKTHMNSSLMESFLLRRINPKSVPKLTFAFILVIKMCNKREANGFFFHISGLFGLVHTGDNRHWLCHPSGQKICFLFLHKLVVYHTDRDWFPPREHQHILKFRSKAQPKQTLLLCKDVLGVTQQTALSICLSASFPVLPHTLIAELWAVFDVLPLKPEPRSGYCYSNAAGKKRNVFMQFLIAKVLI